MKYRGVEQLEARRAHNPEVVGSSPASATIKAAVLPENGCFSNFLMVTVCPFTSSGFRVNFVFTSASNNCLFRISLSLPMHLT